MTKTTIAHNRRARFDYFIENVLEAGIVLMGSEVKSLRLGKVNFNDAYASDQQGELFLVNLNIEPYKQAQNFSHEARRPRKLLVSRRELNKLMGAIHRKGRTLIPLSLYFASNGKVKVELGLAAGKKQVDKRATEKERDWNREKSRVLKEGTRA